MMTDNVTFASAATVVVPVTRSEREHYAWVDLLRVVACFMVVLAHACDPFVGQFETDRTAFLSGVAVGSLMRASVPLFVMMTAVVLLPLRRQAPVGVFYRKRIGRIALPLVFWSLALPVIMWAYYNFINPSTANALLSAEAYTGSALVGKLSTWIWNFNFDTTPLWYLYMLVGLYFVIPVIDAWLQSASRSDVRTLLIVWLCSMLLPWVKMAAPLLGYEGNYGHMGLWGECDWNPYGMLYYVSGFAGYIVLAYYMKTWPLTWSSGKMWAVFAPLFAIGYVITFTGFVIIQNYYPGNYAYLEIIWYFCGLNVWMMTVSVFAAMQRVKGVSGSGLSRLAGLTFGIYLCHFPFEYVAYDMLDFAVLPSWLRIIGGAVVTFVIAAVLCRVMSMWRPTRRLIA